MKEAEPVVEVLPAESIQDVKEDIEEQKQSPIIVLFHEAIIPVTNEATVCAKK